MLLFHEEGKIQATGPYTIGTAAFFATCTMCFLNCIEEHFV